MKYFPDSVTRYFWIWNIAVFIFITATPANAQNKTLPVNQTIVQKEADSLSREKDVIDLLNIIIKSHFNSKPDTSEVKAGSIHRAIAPAIGYTLQGSFLASVAYNVSVYTSNPDSTKLSTNCYGFQYDLNHQVIITIISDIWQKKNIINWQGDWRYYIYPSYIYGLGGKPSQSTADLIDYSYLRLYQEALGHLNNFYYLGGGFNYDNHFNIHEEGQNADYDLYSKGVAKTISSGPVLHLMYDSRKNINNPINATYASVTYRNSNSIFGSSESWQSVFAEFKEYLQLSGNSPNTLCFWSWNVFTFAGNAPYFDLPANGWDINSNSGRGYIQGRFRGQNLVYDEAEYRFRITSNGLIGGVVFANAESVSEYPGNKFQYIDPGEGVGVRLKMNKYSDVNLCIDYAIGLYGSRGVFFNLGEVF